MDQLIKELRSSLLATPDISIIKDQVWKLPIVSYDVSFNRVKRLKMDILMKMLLFAFQESDIRRAAALADMLLVEELFIRDLIDKMQRGQLIQLEKKGFKLTAKGYNYLEKGIFDEDMEGDQTLISYSAIHDDYLLTAETAHPEAEEKLPLYRYDAAKGSLKKDRMQQLLAKEMVYPEEESFQIIVTDITACIEHKTHWIPCIEFQLYDQKQDVFYARVWNTLKESWDETLAKQIEEREVVKWRKAMEQRESALG
ncbi:hypothetical protein [Planococcus shenhongbingii]|uniref:Transcriptional regulator n=1 Tax=Planococcus shenhongbingii TaxID=3058398 RepID=A0ABT8NEY5_9BACL|nr:hypothetical protein [Planococcus sp. N017]MDN7246323.1 hypothetical protein [Planococcus sp. N017]